MVDIPPIEAIHATSKTLKIIIMKNEITTLTNDNGETYYSKEVETGRVIFSFTQDFEDYWTEEDEC